jgi:hypothetical protein
LGKPYRESATRQPHTCSQSCKSILLPPAYGHLSDILKDENDIGHSQFAMGALATFNVHSHPAEAYYLPTAKHSPLVTPVEGHIDPAAHSEAPLNVIRSRTPPPSAFATIALEDEIMQSPGGRPSSPQKRRLVMGYREDCESCRLRIPGHFNHYI